MDLYFVAVIPPEDVSFEIQHLKEEIREKFGAEHALKLPPHITLLPPFKMKTEREMQLLQALEVFATMRAPFHIWLSGFGHFDSRVLFVKVEEKEKLIDLHDSLCENLSAIPEIINDTNFHPHVTLATRDLHEAVFPEARKFLSSQDYESRFEVTGLSLFKHDGQNWETLMDFYFKKS